MSTTYELSIYRRKVDVLMGVATLTDDVGNANDRWVFKGDGAINLNIAQSGTWFRTDSYSKVTFVGDDDRILADFKYRSWPLTSGALGFLRTIREMSHGEEGDFYYVVERVS